MEIAWDLYTQEDGWERVSAILNEKYRRFVQKAMEEILAGEEKALVVFTVKAKMELLLSSYAEFGADDTEPRAQLADSLCEVFGISSEAFIAAKNRLYQISMITSQRLELESSI